MSEQVNLIVVLTGGEVSIMTTKGTAESLMVGWSDWRRTGSNRDLVYSLENAVFYANAIVGMYYRVLPTIGGIG